MSAPIWFSELKSYGVIKLARDLGHHVRGRAITGCPACKAENRSSSDSRGAVSTGDGVGWTCHLCGAKGDPTDFLSCELFGARYDALSSEQKKAVYEKAVEAGYCQPEVLAPRMGSLGAPRASTSPRSQAQPKVRFKLQEAPPPEEEHFQEEPSQRKRGSFDWREELPLEAANRLWSPEAKPVLEYLCQERGFSEETLEEWKIGAHRDSSGGWWFTIPLRNSEGEIVNIKFGAISVNGVRPKPKYRVCPDRELQLFGCTLLNGDPDSAVVVVEGELDVLALWQYGYRQNIVTSSGGAGTFNQAWVDLLEPYKFFVLLLDSDEAGDKGADELSNKLGVYRCSRAKLPKKDAADCLQAGVELCDIEIAIEQAKPYVGINVRSLASYEERLEQAIEHPEELKGIASGSRKLDELFDGWSYGLNVITGPSGTGKTTWLAWAHWMVAKRGVPCLVFPLEQTPMGMVQKFLRLTLGGDFLSFSREARREAFAEMNNLPIKIVDRYGISSLDETVDTIRMERRRRGIRMVMLDHLGYLFGQVSDERGTIDLIVKTLAKLGRDEGVAINMIAHPTNEHRRNGGRMVSFGDVKGSIAIEQESGMGLVIERAKDVKEPHALVCLDKLRKEWGAGEGNKVLQFCDPVSGRFADTLMGLVSTEGP